MEYELNVLIAILLIITGFIAGFINVLAGGGSFLTIPALMLMGISADVANATNRVGVFLQCAEGVRSFHRHGLLPRQAVTAMLVPTMGGSLIGALVASYLPTTILKPTILITLIAMALLMVLRPSAISAGADEQPISPWQSPSGFIGLFLAGVYGGFIQAGVGFVLIAALAGVLRYDLVRANALKMAATAIFTSIALVVFIARGQVLWVPGLLLAVGSVFGVRAAVRFALSVNQSVMRWLLLFMVVAVCIAVWLS